jgi:hypothetical protein
MLTVFGYNGLVGELLRLLWCDKENNDMNEQVCSISSGFQL